MAKRAFFDEVDTKVDFPSLEKEVLKNWEETGLVAKYRQKNNNSKNYFSFLDGPITANNPMGVHHAWGRTYKDLWQRYKNMRGFKQRFQNGFDCQGLWVEVEVEKELDLHTKKDIENLVPGDKKASIAKFVELCKERVKKYAAIQTEQSQRLAYFMDWDNSYYTLSDENNYMIWHFLKKCHEKGLIYQGHDSVPWCPRCGTAISQHEILTEDYKELTHETVFFKLPVKERNFSLLVWTTTPWTIPANVAVAVNPKFNYVIWESAQRKIVTVDPKEISDPESAEWFAKHIASENLKKADNISGKELVGLTYTGPFDSLERVQKAEDARPQTFHSVVSAEELVVATKGTGILHVAPGAGEEDFALGKEKDLPVIDVIDDEAVYYEGMGEFSGQNAKKHPEIIIDFLKSLKSGEFLFKTAPIIHRYPACWRCKTELVWRVVEEWYISMEPLREPMKKVVKNINWIPEFGLKRELDWVKNMHDWLISKKRYWGLALPIWVCPSCKHFEVMGSKDELKDKAVAGWDKFEGKTPHRPWIDEVKIKCEKCGKDMERISDVGNPWLDAGIVSFSTISEDNKSEPLYLTNKQEFKKWYPADFITESFPGQFKNWFYSLLAMSTVLENTEPFKTVLGYATLLAEDGRAMHKSWGNSIEFNEGADKIGVDVMRWMFLRQNPAENLLFGYHVADETRRRFHLKLWNVYNFFATYANIDGWKPEKISKPSVLDKWILTRLGQTVSDVTANLEKYDAYSASGAIEAFVDDLSLWYIRRSRDRVGPAAESKTDKSYFYQTTYFVLLNLAKLLAPFLPVVSEVIYKNLNKEESVHLADWPVVDLTVDKALVAEMEIVRQVVEKAHGKRKELKIPVRQPLSKLTVKNLELKEKGLTELIMDEVNVKKVEFTSGTGEWTIELDAKITPELEEEAKARELIRKIQDERKNMGLNLTQKISVDSDWIPTDKNLIQRIKSKTLASDLKSGEFKVEKL